jgi:hypothetical protein
MAVRQSPFAFSPHIEFQGAIDSMHPFVIPGMPLPTDQGKELSETISRIPIHQLEASLYNRLVFTGVRPVAINAAADV